MGLLENRRLQLDGIVSKMIQAKEPEENIKFVVNDFKTKYANETESEPEFGGVSTLPRIETSRKPDTMTETPSALARLNQGIAQTVGPYTEQYKRLPEDKKGILPKASAMASDALSLPGGVVKGVLDRGTPMLESLQTRNIKSPEGSGIKGFARDMLQSPATGATTLFPAASIAKLKYLKDAPKIIKGLGSLAGEGVVSGVATEAEGLAQGEDVSAGDVAGEAGFNMLFGGALKGAQKGAKGLGEALRMSKWSDAIIARNMSFPKKEFKVDEFKDFTKTIKDNQVFGDMETVNKKANELVSKKYAEYSAALKKAGVEKISDIPVEKVKGSKGVIDVSENFDKAYKSIGPEDVSSTEEGYKSIVEKNKTALNKKLEDIAEGLKAKGYNIDVVDERKYNALSYMLGVKNPTGGAKKIYADPEATQKLMQDFKSKEIMKWGGDADENSKTKEMIARNLYFNLRNGIDEAVPDAKAKEVGKELKNLILASDLSEAAILKEMKKAKINLNDIISASAGVQATSLLGKVIGFGSGIVKRTVESPNLIKATSALEKIEPGFDEFNKLRPSTQPLTRLVSRSALDEKKRKETLDKLNSIRMR
jgi:hypothetical protein